MGYPL